MGTSRKSTLDRRLDAYFASLRSSPLKDALKRSAANWQIYAAMTSSAIAMATSSSAANIGAAVRAVPSDRAASLLAATQRLVNPNLPFISAIRSAMARQRATDRPLNNAPAQPDQGNPAQAPAISPNGIAPIYGVPGAIQPGEWVTIYGTNLASETVSWNGDFPTTLGGTRVEINFNAAYLMFVSPNQINLQVPDETARGTVAVIVTTAAGSATSMVTLNEYAPSFCLIDTQGGSGYVAGIIVRSNGKGAYGGGTYDILGPTGSSFGYPTVAAQPGDAVELYAVGFGPTHPGVPAGTPFSGAAPIGSRLALYINNIKVKPTFVGLSGAGLYQINLVIPPGLGEGPVPLQVDVGGLQTQPNVVFSLESAISPYPVSSTGGFGGFFGSYIPVFPFIPSSTNIGTPGMGNGTGTGTGGGGGGTGGGGTGGGTGGGGGSGGGGTGASAKPIKKPYTPKLHFPTKP